MNNNYDPYEDDASPIVLFIFFALILSVATAIVYLYFNLI